MLEWEQNTITIEVIYAGSRESAHTIPKSHKNNILIYAKDQYGNKMQVYGCITPSVLMAIKKDYTIETEDNSYGDITELDWYKESKERLP